MKRYRTSVAFSGSMYVLSREWSTDGVHWSVTERIKTKRLEVGKIGRPGWFTAACTMLSAKYFEDLMTKPDGGIQLATSDPEAHQQAIVDALSEGVLVMVERDGKQVAVVAADSALPESPAGFKFTGLESIEYQGMETRIMADIISADHKVDKAEAVKCVIDAMAEAWNINPSQVVATLHRGEIELCQDEGCPQYGTPHVCVSKPPQ